MDYSSYFSAPPPHQYYMGLPPTPSYDSTADKLNLQVLSFAEARAASPQSSTSSPPLPAPAPMPTTRTTSNRRNVPLS